MTYLLDLKIPTSSWGVAFPAEHFAPARKFQYCVVDDPFLCILLLLCLIALLRVQINVATSLVAGGETGIFTPMHLLVFQKPEANGESH